MSDELRGDVLQPEVIEGTINNNNSISGEMASVTTLQGNVNKPMPADYTWEHVCGRSRNSVTKIKWAGQC